MGLKSESLNSWRLLLSLMEHVYWTSTPSTVHPRSGSQSTCAPTIVVPGASILVQVILAPLLASLAVFGRAVHVVHSTSDPHWHWRVAGHLLLKAHCAFANAQCEYDGLTGAGQLGRANAPRGALSWLRAPFGNNYGGLHFDGAMPVVATKPCWAKPAHPQKGDSISDAAQCFCGACAICAPLIELIYFHDIRLLFAADSDEMLSLRPLIEACERGWHGLKDYNLTPTRRRAHTIGDMLKADEPTAHSKRYKHCHYSANWHTSKNSWPAVGVRRRTKNDVGAVKPVRSPDGTAAACDGEFGGRPFQLLWEGIVAPLLPFIYRARAQLVPVILWGLVRAECSIFGCGYSYVAFNLLGDASMANEAPSVAFEGALDPVCGMHLGVEYHYDTNNTGGGCACLCVLGDFSGYASSFPTLGFTLTMHGWSILFGDFLLLHAVHAGFGFRISVLLCSHESIAYGWRPIDGKEVLYEERSSESREDCHGDWQPERYEVLVADRAAMVRS